jgi:hypothetical protein
VLREPFPKIIVVAKLGSGRVMKLISPDQASAINQQFLQQAFFHRSLQSSRGRNDRFLLESSTKMKVDYLGHPDKKKRPKIGRLISHLGKADRHQRRYSTLPARLYPQFKLSTWCDR